MTKMKSGRPPRTSREQMLEAALELLQEGSNRLSIRNLAERLGTAPTSIYNYFTNKEALLNALAERALKELWIDCTNKGEWEKSLRNWMNRSRTLLVNNPELIQLIGLVAASTPIVEKVEQLADLLRPLGFSAKQSAEQAQSLLWEVVGFSLLEIGASTPAVVARNRAGWSHTEFSNFGKLMAVNEFDALWKATVNRSMVGIEVLAAKRNRR